METSIEGGKRFLEARKIWKTRNYLKGDSNPRRSCRKTKYSATLPPGPFSTLTSFHYLNYLSYMNFRTILNTENDGKKLISPHVYVRNTEKRMKRGKFMYELLKDSKKSPAYEGRPLEVG